jgi:hypothetical protein
LRHEFVAAGVAEIIELHGLSSCSTTTPRPGIPVENSSYHDGFSFAFAHCEVADEFADP